MSLDISLWHPFTMGYIFDILNGSGITKEEIEQNPGDFIAVQSGEENNGCIGRIDYQYCVEKGYTLSTEPCLTVARSGSAGFVSFQPHGCVVGDSAKILLIKDNNGKSTLCYLFLQTLLKAIRRKYDYGRKVTEEKYSQELLMLPSIDGVVPDWKYMEHYIKSLNHKPLSTLNRSKNKFPALSVNGWKKYRLGDLFDIRKGKRLTSEDQTEGSTPYIGAIDSNNGVANHIGQAPIHAGNTISLSYNGSVGEAFYQPEPFWATDDVNVLYFRSENGVTFNQYLALFFCTILRKEQYRYCYGRKWGLDSMKETIIELPSIGDKPDWQWMEKYIKSLPYGDRI